MPWPLAEAAKKRCTEEGYRSLSRYYIGLVLRDAITPQSHAAVVGVANLDPKEQDEVLDHMLEIDKQDMARLFLRTIRREPTRLLSVA